MAADVVNLNKARKAKARQAEAETTRVNRVRHGRSAAQAACDSAERRQVERGLDGARLRPAEDDR